MSTIIPFAFPETGQPVRTVTIGDEPWFVGKDACDVVGISKYRDALAQLDEDERASAAVDTPGGQQNMTFVSESGLYALMLISRSPKVKAFRRWVTREVIPSIRKTGSYSAPPDELELAERNVQLIKEKRVALARAEQAEAFKTAIEGGDGLTLRAFHKKYFSALTEKAFMDHLYGRGYLINQRGKGARRDDGTFRDGSQHRHPAAKGKPFFYLHGHGEIGGARRENTRVRPGAPELELKARLIKDGLAANNNDTGQPRAIESASALPMELEAQR